MKKTRVGQGTKLVLVLKSGPTVQIEHAGGLTVEVESSLIRKGNLQVATRSQHLRVSWLDLGCLGPFGEPERRSWFFDQADVERFDLDS